MKITIYNMKGSAGKTPPYNLLDTVIPEERLISLQPDQAFPELPDSIEVVFDLAGLMTRDAQASILSAVKQSDVIVVPIYNELKCIHAGIHTIRELLPHNKNIVVVATKLAKKKGEFFTDWNDSDDLKNIKNIISETVGQGIPVFPLKFSKVFDVIFEREMSIGQLMQNEPLARYTYKDVAAQFDALFSYLEKTYA